MANQNLNPLSRLLDIDFPEIKRSNWNASHDHATTSDVGFVKPVLVDHLMAGTRAKLDFNSASFANSTIAPLYGRYKVKYLAFWAPDRLYMPDWLTGEKMIDDNYPYPYIDASNGEGRFVTNFESPDYINLTGANQSHVPVASLCDYLKIFPAYTNLSYFHSDDRYPNKHAFSFLAFWDAYRTFILNPQETTFPVRVRAFRPQLTGDMFPIPLASEPPRDYSIAVTDLDNFFKSVKRSSQPFDVRNEWIDAFQYDPLFADKRVWQTKRFPTNSLNPITPDYFFFQHELNYGLPIAPYSPDMFTSFISNENVELERTKSKVTTSTPDASGRTSFTMESWYLASRIQSKIRKNIYKLQDFSQWIDTNFGIKPPTTLTQPMFLGAFSSDIIFNDVMSTIQQGDDNAPETRRDLGSRAGYGIGKDGANENFFDFTAQEPGTVMILQWIVPEVFYFEHSHKFYETLNFNEEYNPIYDALGFQDLHRADMNLVPNLSTDPSGVFVRRTGTESAPSFTTYNYAVAQQPYAMEHMGKNNILSGQMVQPEYYQSWSLARSFNYIRGLGESSDIYLGSQPMGSYSSYIIPEMYNNIFSNTLRAHNFQFYLSFDYMKYQPVSKQFLSFSNN